MSRARLLPITTLVFIAAVPLAWLACGGGSKPPETPSGESASAEPAGSDTPTSAASASSATAADTATAATATAEAPAPAAAPPPAATFGSTDCGKCLDKSCAKQAAACGKDTDCQSTLDTIHSCTSGGPACVGGASAPSSAKAKKLAAAYEACAKKAAAAKACKAKCQ
ncbi:MAG: hypothetical protein M3O46_05995 [Myxococcota bacterium]|nr:hypothetical protein [Myxococcota bacterium]